MGLSEEGLIRGGEGGGYMRVKIMAIEATAVTDTIRQTENLYLKK